MYPPDGLLTSGNSKHDVDLNPHIIAPDPFASDDCLDDLTLADLFLLTTSEGLNTMNTSEDDLSSSLNGRLRPRKSNNPSPQSNKVLRKSDTKSNQEKPKRSSTPTNVSSNKPDNPVVNSDNTQIPHILCPFCEKKFVTKQTALKHARRIHLSSSKQDIFIECLFCSHGETESNDIIRHMVDSHPNQYFACLDCHTRFSSTSALAEHKLNVCEKQKLSYRSKLRKKSSESLKGRRQLNKDGKGSHRRGNKEYQGHGFNGIVISCELKPANVNDEADIEDNITTNVILPPSKGLANSALIEKNAVIVLDDIQWNKRIPSNFSFHNSDADQILSRLGVVHRSPRTAESTKRDWLKTIDDAVQKFEKCFDTSFYTKVASNVQENLSKYLDGSFNANPDPDSTIKTRKAKNCVAINTAEGFPILLACEQYSRNLFDGYMPRAIAPKHKWKWDSPDNDRGIINPDQIKRDSHLNNCIITLVSNLDIWTQLRMRRKFEDKFNCSPLEKKTEKRNTISKELKEILESRELPTSSSQGIKYTNKPISSVAGFEFPALLGLAPATPAYDLQPAVLSGEWVRPRCYVCCACGAETRDSRTLSSHISTQHPNALVQHYEIVGEPLLNAGILKHLYVPPSQTLNRTRPLRGFKECTKCKQSITLEDLHQHMLDCAGDTPTVRRKCRYRPFGVRKRRPRLPDNRIRRKMRKDIRTGQANQKNHMRTRPRIRSEVGDAETIRKMLADLPAKRHRVMVNPLNSLPRRKLERKRNKLMKKKFSLDDSKLKKMHGESNLTEREKTQINEKEFASYNDDDDEDNLPLKPKIKNISNRSLRQKESLNRKAIMNRSKRKLLKGIKPLVKNNSEEPLDCSENITPKQLSIDNTQKRINVNDGSCNTREHANREGSNHRESNNRGDQQPGCSRQNGNSNDSIAPSQNVPLKHSIARLTADSETHDKSVQFHRLFLVQQECNNINHHLPSDRRVLFENEAVVTKLDKPPLHFNQIGIIDHHHPQKNKVGKARKGLNDCIAMLKNKLVPTSDGNVPGHVSVQCGSDEPIEPEPIILEQRLVRLDSKIEIVKKSNNVEIMTASKHERSMNKLSDHHKESFKSDLSSTKIQSTRTLSSDNIEKRKINSDDTPRGVQNTHSNILPNMQSIKQKSESETVLQDNLSITQKQKRSESDISSRDLPSPPQRNTVIKKSPKVSMNVIHQDESKTKAVCANTQAIESNDNLRQSSNELLDNTSQLVMSEMNNKQQHSVSTKNRTESTINNAEKFSTPYSRNLNDVIMPSIDNEQISPKEPDFPQNLDLPLMHKVNSEYTATDYNDIPAVIPLAHASTTVESILSSPLDLSGKHLQIGSSENSSQEITFVMSTYDEYETLDLSNKSSGILQSFERNEITDMEVIADVVVDLSIKPQLKSACQSVPSNLSKKSTITDEVLEDLSYQRINENIPTDLSLKRSDRTSTVNLSEMSGTNLVQDLSSYKSNQKETLNNSVTEVSYVAKNLPTDLSGRGVKSKCSLLEGASLETLIVPNKQENNMKDIIDNLSTKSHSNVDYNHQLTKPNTDGNDYRKSLSEDKEIEVQEYHFTNYSKETHDTQSVNPLHLPKSVNSFELRNLIPESTSHSPELKIIPACENFKSYAEIMPTSSECNVSGSFSETNLNQSSSSLSDSINVVTHHDQSYREHEKPILSVAVSSIAGTVPLYTLTNRSLTTYVPVCKIESTTPVYTLGNACISVTRIDTSSSASLTNTLLSIPGNTISSTTSVYTLAGTTVDTTVNYGKVTPQLKSGNGSRHERCLPYCDRDSSGVHEPQSSATNDTCNDTYDLTKEEIIDCDAEQDTETARKIAMLPKELVEILGTMPIDHRNQLLNVLPQYVSTPIPVTTSPATQSVKNNTSMEPIRPSSSLTHQLTLSSGRTCSLEKSENKNITQLAIKTHIDSKTISSNIDVTPLQNLSQQSVALKSHVANDDCKLAVQNVVRQQCNQTTNKLTPFSNQEHNSTSFRDVQDAVIDLTEDENMQHNKSDVQVIKHTFIKSSCILENRKLEAPIKPKGSNDQTASLRAVRIKTPSERNKHMATEISTESENDVNISLRTASVYSSANGKQTTTRTLCDDLLKTEISNTHEDNKNDVIDTNFNLNKANISSTGISDLNKYRVAPCSLMRNDELLQDSLNHVSETKVTIATSSKEVSEEVSYEKKRDSSPSKVENIIIDIEDDNQDCQSQTRFTEKGLNSDEDSDDDISLAVIVKQKQRDQYMSSSCEKSKQFSVNPVNNDNKKRKRDKKSKKYCINDDNEEILLKKPSNSKNNLGNGTKFVEVSHNVITNKNHESLSSEYQVYNSNTLKSENEVGPVIDLKNAGYSPRNNRKSRRHVSVSKSVEEPNKIQKTNIYTLDINKNNDVIAECSLRLNNSESVESDHSITMTYDGDNDDSGTDVVEVAFRTLNKSTENVVVLSESKQKEKEESFSTTSKDNIQNVNKLTSEIDNTEVNDSTKKNTDNQTDAVFNKCNIICNEERKKSEAKVSSLFANNNKSILENVHKTNHGEISIEKHDCESKSKKSSRVKKIKNASFVELSLPQHEIFDSDESFVTPLRRSRRGKSMFIDSNLSELDVTNYTDNSVEQKAPLTKKQLIFSKLLLDEENHMKPRTGSVKEPIVVISNIKISDSHILSSRYTLDSIAKNFKEIKTSKRKKSPQSKRKCKKLKSGHNSQNDDISMSSIGINNDRESDNNIEKYHNNLPLNSKCCIDILNDMTSPTAEVSHTIPKQQNQSLEIGQNEINNKKSNIDAKRDEIDDRYEINIINKPSSAEKRKISCTVTGANCSSSKKSKPNNNVECASDSCNKDELKQNNELLNETKRKSRARNDIFDSSNKFGRNPHVPARRTRSKSVVVKSSSLLYDPYDIDLEDMIDKREPFGRKSSGDKAFENLSFMRDHDFKKRNKSETSVGVNTEPIVNGEFTDNVQVQTTNIVDLKGGTSDSDDSSKSDIPLKKYVEEKERKNLESNRNVILSDCEHNNGERDETDKSENKTDTKEPENNDASSSLKQDQDLKSEQFMESFGFFSERKPRKSNLLAMKKYLKLST